MEDLIKDWKEKFEDIDSDLEILHQEIQKEQANGDSCDLSRLNKLMRFENMLGIWRNQFGYFLERLCDE